MRPKTEKVRIRELGVLTPFAMEEWPSGEFLLQCVKSMSEGKTIELPQSPNVMQAMARHALLVKFGYWKSSPQHTNMEFSKENVNKINKLWTHLVKESSAENTAVDACEDDLQEFMRAGGLSNGRPLQWALLDCPPGCQFRLHAHPNLELVYCVQGAWGVRPSRRLFQVKTLNPLFLSKGVLCLVVNDPGNSIP